MLLRKRIKKKNKKTDKKKEEPVIHKYLKTKANLLLYQKDHEIKTDYHRKYDKRSYEKIHG